MSFNFKKNFQNVGGTSIVTPELLREDSSATDTLNVDMYDNYGLCSRRGEESIFTEMGRTIAALTTSQGEKIIIRSGTTNAILRVLEETLTVTFTGSEELRVEVGQEFVNIFNTKYIAFYKDEVLAGKYSLGSVDNGNKTMLDLINEVSITGVSLSVPSGQSTIQCSGIGIFNKTLVGASNSIPYEYSETIAGPNIPVIDAKPFDFIERDGVVYFTTGNTLFKYDGTSYYPASLPKPLPGTGYSSGVDTTASSSPADGTYRYRVLYEYTDAGGNPIRSTPSDEIVISTNGTNRPRITVNQGSVNINIPGVTATIIRTKEISGGGGSIFFVVGTGIALNTPFFDSVSDASLVEDYPLPPFELNDITNGKYLEIWKGLLVMTGFSQDPDKVLFEDIEYLEGFSTSNSFLTESRAGGENSGIKAQDNALFVFKEDSITLVTGDLGTKQFQVSKLSEEGIGCMSNNSLIESQGSIWFMSSEGIFSVSMEGLREQSGPIEALFEKEYTNKILRDCFAFNNTLDDKLYFNVPELDFSGSLVDVPQTFVFNLKSKKWFIWDTINFARGISINQGEIWYVGASQFAGSIYNTLYKRMPRTFTNVDFSDIGRAINTVYSSHWETLGEPSVKKKFVRVKLYSIDNARQLFESPEFTIDIETEHDYKYGVKVSGASLRFYENNSDGSTNPVNSRRLRLLPRKTRSLRYILRHNVLNENFLISGVEFEVAYEHGNFMKGE